MIGLRSIHLAKPSLSHMSSHHAAGHQVAEPLVSDFMRHHGGVSAFAENRSRLLVHEQRSIAIEDGGRAVGSISINQW